MSDYSTTSSTAQIVPTILCVSAVEQFWAKSFMIQLAKVEVWLIWAGICNLIRVSAITHLLLAKDSVRSLTFTNATIAGSRFLRFNVLPMDGAHIDVLAYMSNTRMTVFIYAEIQTQAWQLNTSKAKCAYF